MSQTRGYFIVIEGIDGAGTTTQSRRLYERLVGSGRSSHLTYEPTDGPVGKLIRDSLSGRIVAPDSEERIRFSEAALSLLFAADRVEHSREIERLRADAAIIVCDRYIHSSIAYQSTDPSISPERVIEVNAGVAVPDLTLFLDVPVDECLRRLGDRNDSPTIYEKKELLDKIDANYRATMKLYAQHFGMTASIDGTLSEDDVHAAIVRSIGATLGL